MISAQALDLYVPLLATDWDLLKAQVNSIHKQKMTPHNLGFEACNVERRSAENKKLLNCMHPLSFLLGVTEFGS